MGQVLLFLDVSYEINRLGRCLQARCSDEPSILNFNQDLIWKS